MTDPVEGLLHDPFPWETTEAVRFANRSFIVPVSHDAEWDAGDMGCGELILHLRHRLRAMPGQVLKLIARDPGAPEDIPAYCRMTGNRLLDAQPDSGWYWIRARD